MMNEYVPLPGFLGCQREQRAQRRMQAAQYAEMKRVVALNWGASLLLPVFAVAVLRIRKKKGILLLIGLGTGAATAMLIYSHSTDAATPQQPFYYHNDHLGTPQFVTDRTGAIVWEGHYKPFGEVFSNNGIANVYQPFRFPGQYEDPETGWYYNWNRYYINSIGKYNSIDPFDFMTRYILLGNIDVFNIYSYSSNPLLHFDISGLKEKEKEEVPYYITCKPDECCLPAGIECLKGTINYLAIDCEYFIHFAYENISVDTCKGKCCGIDFKYSFSQSMGEIVKEDNKSKCKNGYVTEKSYPPFGKCTFCVSVNVDVYDCKQCVASNGKPCDSK